MTTQTKATHTPGPSDNYDLELAGRNFIQIERDEIVKTGRGHFSHDLIIADGFKATKFPYQVWSVDYLPSREKERAILLANQNTLSGVLRYMNQENRVLVYNRDAELNLLAAAPELLEALKLIEEGNTMAGKEGFTHADVIQKHYQIARKAITKAEGKL